MYSHRNFFVICALLASFIGHTEVKITDNTNAPDNPEVTAILDIESISRGLLPPRLTSAQRDVIANPYSGLMICNTDEGYQKFFNGTSWQKVCAVCTPETLPAAAGINQLNVIGTTTQLNATPPSIGTGLWTIVSGHGWQLDNPSDPTSLFTGISGLSHQLRWTTSTLCGNNSSDIQESFALVCGQAQVPVTFNEQTSHYGAVSFAGFCWLDRNLGATQVPQSLEDSLTRGFYFQWGRCANGHEHPLLPVLPTQPTSACPGDGIFRANGNTNWSNNTCATLWEAASANNPCPAGRRIPTYTEFLQPEQVGGWQNMRDAFDSPRKFPATGGRFSGACGSFGLPTFTSLRTAFTTTATRQRYQATTISHNALGKILVILLGAFEIDHWRNEVVTSRLIATESVSYLLTRLIPDKVRPKP